MAGIKATGLFLMGSLAGFGVALLLYFARLLEPILPRLYPGPIDAFVAGLILIAIGLLGSVVVARGSKSFQLRTLLVAIAMVAILLGVVLEVRRRSKEFWGLALQHRTQAAALSARYQLARLDPRVSNRQKAELSILSQWHSRTADRYNWASNFPWLPIEPNPPMPKFDGSGGL